MATMATMATMTSRRIRRPCPLHKHGSPSQAAAGVVVDHVDDMDA